MACVLRLVQELDFDGNVLSEKEEVQSFASRLPQHPGLVPQTTFYVIVGRGWPTIVFENVCSTYIGNAYI